jgi:hypothetical protein
MDAKQVLVAQIATNLISWALVARWFVWPRLRALPREAALTPLVAMHWIRTLGLFALVPAMSSEYAAQSTWAHHVAIGDLVTVFLAMIAVGTLRARHRLAIPLTWLFNVWGALDCVNAARNGAAEDILGHALGPHIVVITFCVPLLVVSHIMIFVLLARRSS